MATSYPKADNETPQSYINVTRGGPPGLRPRPPGLSASRQDEIRVRSAREMIGLAKELLEQVPRSRSQACAITKLDEARFWIMEMTHLANVNMGDPNDPRDPTPDQPNPAPEPTSPDGPTEDDDGEDNDAA